MSDLIGETVVPSSYSLRQQVAWVGENRKKKEFNYPNVPSNVLSWNKEPDDGGYKHKLLISNLLGQLIHDLAWERPQWTFLVVSQVGRVVNGRDAQRWYHILTAPGWVFLVDDLFGLLG